MNWNQIKEAYPIGCVVKCWRGKLHIVRGYGSAMFTGRDTDMALAVYGSDREFLEIDEVIEKC